MHITTHTQNGHTICIVDGTDKIITDTGSALSLAMDLQYQHNCNRIAIDKSLICEDFFILSTGLAGEILQKLTNYHIKMAIYGDYSRYTSKPLKDFIYESNKGNQFFFVETKELALEKLANAK